MYKKILVPLDGSDLSECTLEHLKAVATGCHVAEVVLLWALEPIHPTEEFDENWRRQAEQKAVEYAKDYMTKTASRLQTEGIAVSTAVVSGVPPASAIVDYAKENQADLIIISTHGRSGISRWVLGSVADKVIHHAGVPVLSVTPAGCRVS